MGSHRSSSCDRVGRKRSNDRPKGSFSECCVGSSCHSGYVSIARIVSPPFAVFRLHKSSYFCFVPGSSLLCTSAKFHSSPPCCIRTASSRQASIKRAFKSSRIIVTLLVDIGRSSAHRSSWASNQIWVPSTHHLLPTHLGVGAVQRHKTQNTRLSTNRRVSSQQHVLSEATPSPFIALGSMTTF